MLCQLDFTTRYGVLSQHKGSDQDAYIFWFWLWWDWRLSLYTKAFIKIIRWFVICKMYHGKVISCVVLLNARRDLISSLGLSSNFLQNVTRESALHCIHSFHLYVMNTILPKYLNERMFTLPHLSQANLS